MTTRGPAPRPATPRRAGGRLTVIEAGDRPLWGAAAEGVPSTPPALAAGSADGWRSFDRILCIRLDAIGDVLMTTPAFRALKAARPERHLTLLTSSAGAAAGRLVPDIDEVIVYDPPWMKATPSRDGPAADRELIETLAVGGYDAAAIFTVHTQPALPAALLASLAGIPRRLAHSREKPYQLLTEWLPEPEPDEPLRHEVRRQLDLVAAVGLTVDARDERLSLRVPADASRRIRDRLARLGVDAREPWLLVHPGSTAPSRTYPAPSWAAAIRELAASTGWPVVWSGGPNERSFVRLVRDAAGVGHLLAGELTFAELAALVAVAPLLLTNNTGPAHLAAAVGTPVVDVYAQTNAQHGPWEVPNRVLFADVPCRGCGRSVCPMGHHRCLRDVPPSAIVGAALDLAGEVGIVGSARAAIRGEGVLAG